jgi:hypothetical protein
MAGGLPFRTHNKQNAEHTKQNPEQKNRYVSGLGIKTTQNHPSIGIMIFWNFSVRICLATQRSERRPFHASNSSLDHRLSSPGLYCEIRV